MGEALRGDPARDARAVEGSGTAGLGEALVEGGPVAGVVFIQNAKG